MELYKQIKWLILIIPTLTIWIWEFVRHEYLLPYLSMDAGNWLSPLIVFLITLLLLTKLFAILETIQAELQHSKQLQAALQERENLAKELHDGIAQSLFLVSVKLDQVNQNKEQNEQLLSIKKTVLEVNEYVRQSIAHLKYPPEAVTVPWENSISDLINEMHLDSKVKVEYKWPITEIDLTVKEKLGLYEFLREGLLNIRKHAEEANHIRIRLETREAGWRCVITDNGLGFAGNPLLKEGSYGLKFLKEKTFELGWELDLRRESGRTTLSVLKKRQVEQR
ncbi:sensor histidine kinase [Paenibacillus sp. FJAT-27812]|uniref:sensor histidine kinase n=1 Tax=Paenibacillus sp. FJAT-27812 TaxID=1684143 RepID=UPI0006A7A515|nr:histidine kinase [Paenibacillus sp. FJAT-27812]